MFPSKKLTIYTVQQFEIIVFFSSSFLQISVIFSIKSGFKKKIIIIIIISKSWKTHILHWKIILSFFLKKRTKKFHKKIMGYRLNNFQGEYLKINLYAYIWVLLLKKEWGKIITSETNNKRI
jgi:hypothetical protein